MPMMRAEKEARVEELTKFLEGNNVILLSDFTGLDVETGTEIRRRFREESVEFRVVKNTLASLDTGQIHAGLANPGRKPFNHHISRAIYRGCMQCPGVEVETPVLPRTVIENGPFQRRPKHLLR